MATGEWVDQLDEAVGEDELLKPRRRLEDTEMDITPMIDITFLLLIFFLVASKLAESTPVQLPQAEYGSTVPTRNSVIITVDKGEGEGPAAVYKGDGAEPGTQIATDDLEALEQELFTYVADSMTESQKQYVLIKAAKGVKHRDVARVARAAGRVADVQQLHVAVLEVQ